MITIERIFPPDLPAARGHFPGNPVIPGAVLLSETLRAIETRLNSQLLPGQLASAKFLHPARPGDRVRIEFSDASSGSIRFACSVGATQVLTGVVTGGSPSIPG